MTGCSPSPGCLSARTTNAIERLHEEFKRGSRPRQCCPRPRPPNRGFDAQTGDYVDMVKAGIIDSTKVVRLALQNAASVAGLLVTTEAMVAEKPEKKTPPAMPPGGMGGMDEF